MIIWGSSLIFRENGFPTFINQTITHIKVFFLTWKQYLIFHL
jgi:hypothetical protein